MTTPDNAVTACPDLSADALAILLDHSLKPVQRLVKLLQLADPNLSQIDLARALGLGRNTIGRATSARANLVQSRQNGAPQNGASAPEWRDASRERALPRSSVGDESPTPEITPSLLDAEPTSQRQKRQTLARDFIEARRAAGHPIDPRDTERNYRRVVTALGPFIESHTREQLLAVAPEVWTITDRSIRVGLSKLIAAQQVPLKPNAGGWQRYSEALATPGDSYGEPT